MHDFQNLCKNKFPSNWRITNEGNARFEFRDSLLAKGKGYIIIVQEESIKFEADIKFEDFAKELSDIATSRIKEDSNPLRRIIDSCNNLTSITTKQYVQINLNQETNKFDSWSLKLIYRKKNDNYDYDNFSDILISFILHLFSYQVDSEEEGLMKSELVTKFERSHVNRSLCLAYHGYDCAACKLNLQSKYGNIARNFIHVHHINPLSTSGIHKPDPISDFVPLCPNCHSIAHLENPAIPIARIREIIKENE